jgi:hypothetical protein
MMSPERENEDAKASVGEEAKTDIGGDGWVMAKATTAKFEDRHAGVRRRPRTLNFGRPASDFL